MAATAADLCRGSALCGAARCKSRDHLHSPLRNSGALNESVSKRFKRAKLMSFALEQRAAGKNLPRCDGDGSDDDGDSQISPNCRPIQLLEQKVGQTLFFYLSRSMVRQLVGLLTQSSPDSHSLVQWAGVAQSSINLASQSQFTLSATSISSTRVCQNSSSLPPRQKCAQAVF